MNSQLLNKVSKEELRRRTEEEWKRLQQSKREESDKAVAAAIERLSQDPEFLRLTEETEA